MDTHQTPPDRPEPRPAGGAHTERRYARRIDCAERPRPAPSAEPAAPPAPPAPPAPRRDDAHR